MAGAAQLIPGPRPHSRLLAPYLRLALYHGDPADQADDADMRRRLAGLRHDLDPWWLRTVGSNDITCYDLDLAVPLDDLVQLLARWIPDAWRAAISRHG